jgi:hypothetical protein
MAMSVYLKLQKARVELQKVEMTKSGVNTYSKYKYFELGDFMPHINRIMLDVGLCGAMSFSDVQAELVIFDTESEQKIVFYSPTADATVKGANAIQCLGSLHTYMRRYLWMLAFEIVEHDAIDQQPAMKQADFEALLTSVADLQQLSTAWQSIPKEFKSSLTSVKDAMKNKLQEAA